MTDVARRQARTQKQRIDTALLDRRRREALADLGESLYDLATGGEIELDELPELVRAVQAVEDIDREIAEAELAASEASQARRPVRLGRTRSGGAGWQPDRDRGREPARSGERVWRPPVDAEPAPPPAAGERGDRAAAAGSRAAGAGVGGKPSGSSGKASSSGGKASSGASSGKTSSGGASKATGSGAGGKVAATSGAGKAASNAAGGKASGGGIVFLDDDSAPSERDPDDSLESYMNEEDVPRRG